MNSTERMVVFVVVAIVGGILAGLRVIVGEAWIALVGGMLVPSPLEKRMAGARFGMGGESMALLLILLTVVGCVDAQHGHVTIGNLSRATIKTEDHFAAGAIAITPITSLAAPASGLTYSGDSYNVACTISGTATLYPAVYDGTKWQVWQDYPCTLDSAKAAQGSCTLPSPLQGSGLTWNVFKLGSGTVSSCTAVGRTGPAPAIRPVVSSGGSGTVTEIECLAGLSCSPDPITSAGTIAPDFGTAALQVVQGGVIASGICTNPSSVTYNAAGQITACTAGSAPTSGTVTSVGMSLPGEFSVSGSPVTTNGTLAATWATQAANIVFSGPASGAAATPSFRALVSDDIPALPASKIASGTLDIARLPTGTGSTQVPVGGVVVAATCANPASVTYNAAGQITSCTAGTVTGWSAYAVNNAGGILYTASSTTQQFFSNTSAATFGANCTPLYVPISGSGFTKIARIDIALQNALTGGGTIRFGLYDGTAGAYVVGAFIDYTAASATEVTISPNAALTTGHYYCFGILGQAAGGSARLMYFGLSWST